MVICKFYQAGNCRYGSKCINEHFDVKQIIKSDVEAALKGSQWPLSCFGPFKEKSCIPNFIEDQSYEEVRWLCYQAKQQNCFPAFQHQFTQDLLTAQNKMKGLLNLTREGLDVITKIYDGANTAKGTTQSLALSGSSYASNAGMFGNANKQSNLFSNPNAFGGSASGGSIFGGQGSTPSSGGSVLGQSVFGNTFGSNQSSIFGGLGLKQPGPQSSNPMQGSIFGGVNQQPQSAMNSIFHDNSQQQQQQQQQSQPFNSANLFGGTPQTNIFGQAIQQQSSQFPGSSGNIFSQQNAQSFRAFAQQVQQQQPNQTFSPQSMPNAFGQQVQAQLVSQQQVHQNLFNVSQQNTFGQMQQQQPTANQFINQSTGLFGGQQPIATQNAFTNANQGQQNLNVFGQTEQVLNQQFQVNGTAGPTSELIYSKMEDLTADEIEAFKAENFVIGKIPTKPPPRELVN